MTDNVLFNIDARGVATITLNKPDMHNAFDENLIARLTALFKDVAQNASIRVLVLSANGKSFCAGADLNWMKKMASYSYEQNLQDANALADMFYQLYTIPQPTIARIQGAAFGGGVGLISCCDMAVGSKLSKYCLSEVKLGLIPATIGPYVMQAIGPRAAKRYFMSAEVFTARRARRIGLLSESVTEEELDGTVQGLIDSILNNGPKAVSAAKALVQDLAYQPINKDLIADTSSRIAAIRVSPEGQEGLSAFLDKRTPAWKE